MLKLFLSLPLHFMTACVRLGLFNLGFIALLTPVHVDPLVRQLDWPFLIAVTLMATAFLWRGRVGRGAGLLLLGAYAAYLALHLVLAL